MLGDSPSFEDERAAFGNLDERLVAYEMSLALGGRGCGPADRGPALVEDATYRTEVLAAAVAADDGREELTHRVFEDPAAVRDQLGRMLERYWGGAFRAEWERLLPRIEGQVTAGAQALVTRGVPGLVPSCSPKGTGTTSRRSSSTRPTHRRAT